MESPLCGTEPSLTLIETLLWDGADFLRLPLHLARLEAAARLLGWRCRGAEPALRRAAQDHHERMRLIQDATLAHTTLANATLDRTNKTQHHPARMRLTLDADGQIAVTSSAAPAPLALWRVGLAAERLHSADPWLRIKSSRRAAYDAARAALPAGLDEVVFLNECGEVCDGTITTLFFDEGQGLCTPPLTSGLLPGVLRADLLANGCREAVLPAENLPHTRLWLGNSLRGLAPAVWAG